MREGACVGSSSDGAGGGDLADAGVVEVAVCARVAWERVMVCAGGGLVVVVVVVVAIALACLCGGGGGGCWWSSGARIGGAWRLGFLVRASTRAPVWPNG